MRTRRHRTEQHAVQTINARCSLFASTVCAFSSTRLAKHALKMSCATAETVASKACASPPTAVQAAWLGRSARTAVNASTINALQTCALPALQSVSEQEVALVHRMGTLFRATVESMTRIKWDVRVRQTARAHPQCAPKWRMHHVGPTAKRMATAQAEAVLSGTT